MTKKEFNAIKAAYTEAKAAVTGKTGKALKKAETVFAAAKKAYFSAKRQMEAAPVKSTGTTKKENKNESAKKTTKTTSSAGKAVRSAPAPAKKVKKVVPGQHPLAGVEKSEAHKLAISEGMKAKWAERKAAALKASKPAKQTKAAAKTEKVTATKKGNKTSKSVAAKAKPTKTKRRVA